MGVEGKAAGLVWRDIVRLVCGFHTQQAIDERLKGDQSIPPEDKVCVAAAWRKLFYWASPQVFGEALWAGFLGAVDTFLKDDAVVRHADSIVPYLRATYGLPAYQPGPGGPFVAGVADEGTAAGAARAARLKGVARSVFMGFRQELVVGDRCVTTCVDGYTTAGVWSGRQNCLFVCFYRRAVCLPRN